MTLCDWIILLELVALAVAGIRIWHLGDERNRVVVELDEAYLAGSAARIDRDRVVKELALADGWLARTVRIARRLRAERDVLNAELDAAYLAGAAVRIERYRGDAHADRVQQLARRVTELEGRLSEAGSRIDELLTDNAAALGIQSGGGR